MSEKYTAPKKVAVLSTITPTVESARAHKFEYRNLQSAVNDYTLQESAMQDIFWNSDEDSLDEDQSAQQLAQYFMLKSADRLNNKTDSPISRQLWSDRYTEASIEYYGAPNKELARKLIATQVGDILANSRGNDVDEELSGHLQQLAEKFNIDVGSTVERDAPFSTAALEVGHFLDAEFSDVYDALELNEAPDRIDMSDLADRFERAVSVLAEKKDIAWAEWVVDRNDVKDQLSVMPAAKKIVVGMKRADVSPEECKGLFTHEVLLHAQKAVNGSKVSKEFGSGLPGYLDAEEGQGVFLEYAVTGKVPEKNIDRYVDISLALGMIDGKKRTRNELIDFATTRALIRNELRSERIPDEDVLKSVYAHVNRIYRGSLGNEYVGVFTKDIAYHKGFLEMGEYISNELISGRSIKEIMIYLLSGKFDPTNRKHIAAIEQGVL